jgi:hypothetical protein
MLKPNIIQVFLKKIHTETTGSKNWWNLVKSLLGDSNNRSIPPIQTDDVITHDDTEKSEIFNDYFCDQSDINDDCLIPPDLDGFLYDKLRQIIITETDVDDILKTLDTSKATGPDMLNPRLLKEASSILKYPLCKHFNLSLSTSIFPTEWTFANVTPVFKKDSPCNVKKYRPISLISIIGKIMER